ncbi:MaoC family dehydratase [Arthrobacter pigmenti]|nr:MaoC/PaaZ C-terminal domain-containing protein [Arthrobacter pigmenti]
METRLESVPTLSALYGKALTHAIGARMPGGKRQQTLPAARHRVEPVSARPEHVRAFQALMGQPAGEFMPSGYQHVLAFPVAMSVLARDDFPLPLLGMIHLRNDVEDFSPVKVSEELSVTAWVENLKRHRSGTTVDAVVELENSTGLAWRGRSTYLAKGTYLPDSTEQAPASDAASDGVLPDYPTTVWTLGPDAGRRYAAISGDYNPIHLSGPSARLLGMRKPIAHGMYLASRMVAEAGPREWTPMRWTVDFHSPVPLPSKVFLALDVDRPGSEWEGANVTAWDPRRRRTHFTGRMESLG